MTRLPCAHVLIGAGRRDFPTYPATERCSSPYCASRGHERHHIVRRSWLNGDYWWVEIEGEVQPNIVWLCNSCHRQITENERRIRWQYGRYEWVEDEETDEAAPLDPYPPGPPVEGVAVGDAAVSSTARSLVGELERATPSTDGPHDHTGVPPGSTCPKCRRRVNYPKKADSPKSNIFQFRIPLDDLDSFAQLVEDAGADLKDLRYWKFRLIEAAITIAMQDPDWLRVREMFSDTEAPDDPQDPQPVEEGEEVLPANREESSDQGGHRAT